MSGPPVAAIIATLDTKSEEVAYILERLSLHGVGAFVVDAGIRGRPGLAQIAVTRDEVAAAAGTTIEHLLSLPDRGPAIAAMMDGLEALLPRLHREGRFDRILSIGGFNGALLGAAAMRGLPFGMPKLILSPIASGARTFEPFVHSGDVAVMHSVVDLQGLNGLARQVLDAAVAMISAGGWQPAARTRAGRVVAITVNGNTTPVATTITTELRTLGWEVVPFHSNGAGGASMERLLRAGEFDAVVDLTLSEVSDALLGGIYPGPADRLAAMAERRTPAVIVPGCLDFINAGPVASLPEHLRGRPRSPHNPEVTLVRPTLEQASVIAAYLGRRLAEHPGPVEVVLPERGLSMPGSAGGSFHDPAWDAGFLVSIEAALPARVPRHRVAAGINDDAVAEAVIGALVRITAAVPRAT